VAVHSDGTGDFLFYHDGGLAPLREEDVDASYVASAGVLHFGSISRIEPAGRAATDKARRIAADAGLIVSYDPNYRRRLWSGPDEARRRIREGFDGATLAKVSSEEWEFIFGSEDFRRGAAWLFDRGAELVVRSEGASGASFATLRASGHVEAFGVRSVEFTGAGDAFTASLLVDLLDLRRRAASPGELDEGALRRIVRRANAVGALTTTRPGAIPALPRREEVDRFLSAFDEGRPGTPGRRK
jgi:fructokinase